MTPIEIQQLLNEAKGHWRQHGFPDPPLTPLVLMAAWLWWDRKEDQREFLATEHEDLKREWEEAR